MISKKIEKHFKDWKIVLLAGFLVVFLSLFIRSYNLNSLPVFADEAIYVRWAQVMRAEPTLRFLPLSDGKQPLFMWVIIPLLKTFSDPVIAGRFVSVFTSLGTLLGVFVLTVLLFGKIREIRTIVEIRDWLKGNIDVVWVALLAAFIYAISPYSVFFDRMALADSMLAMFGVWTLFFGTITAMKMRLDTAMFTGFALGGALLTKSPSLFFVILLPSTFLFAKLGDSSKQRVVQLIKLGVLYGVVLIVGYAMYNILRLGPNFHLISSRNQDYVFPITHVLESPTDPLKFFLHRSYEWIRTLGPVLVLIFALLSLFANARKYRNQIIILFAWFFLPILIQSEFAKVFTARYIYFSIPYLFVLAATAFLPIVNRQEDSGHWGNRTVVKSVVLLALLVFTVSALRIDYLLLTNPRAAPLPRSERSGYLEEWTAGTGIKEASEIIRRQAENLPDGSHVVVGTEGFFGTLPDAMQAYLNDLPEITVIGVGLDLTEIPSSLVESRNAGNKTYLVANSSRLNFGEAEFTRMGLDVVASYKKADRPDGFKEYVQHGPHDTLYLFEVVGDY